MIENKFFDNIYKDVEQSQKLSYFECLYQLLDRAKYPTNSELRTAFGLMDMLEANQTIDLTEKQKTLINKVIYAEGALPSGQMYNQDVYNFRKCFE